MDRIEYKIEIHISNKIHFYNFMKKKKAKQIFNSRTINSIYFDNSKLDSFDYRNFTANIKKFNTETGWKPKININDGIIRTIDYLTINKYVK